ncbi:MAG: two-component system activity regulator YycH [Paenibacillaceae bacterium]
MIEKSKTILLVLLVSSSLLQSYLLAYHSSDFEPILVTDYVETEKIGTQVASESLFYPQQIILHKESETHAVLFPQHAFFDIIYDKIRAATFEGIRTSASFTQQLREQNQENGVEIRFGGGVPLSVFNLFIPLKLDFVTQVDRISAMWLTVNKVSNKVDIFLVNESETAVYEIITADISMVQVIEFIGLNELQVKHKILQNHIYIPVEDIAMNTLIYKYTSITTEQMENILFPDPGITRNLPTRDGTEIYSDGKRGLQIKTSQLWMSYTDPIAPLEDTSDTREDLNAAIQFINQRGGWNGQFRIDYVAPNLTDKGQRIIFRQYLPVYPAAYPILEQDNQLFGHIAATLQGGTISEYERSLIMMETKPASRSEKLLPGGQRLEERLLAYSNLFNVEAIYPAYRPQITPEYVEFKPLWVVELNNGVIEELP